MTRLSCTFRFSAGFETTCGLAIVVVAIILSFEVSLEYVELLVPEFVVEGQPLLGRPEGFGIESYDLKVAASLSCDELGGLQHFEVLGYGGQRHGVGLRDLADGLGLCGDVLKDGATRGV